MLYRKKPTIKSTRISILRALLFGYFAPNSFAGSRCALLALCLFLFSPIAFAQETYSVSGTIFNPADQLPLPGATTVVLSAKDSSLIAGSTTDPEGFFTVKNLPTDDYILKVSFVGHEAMYKTFAVEGRSLGLGMMVLRETPLHLEEFEVVARHVQMTEKGDTLVYNAAAAKLDRNSTADHLLKKMAGIQSKDGSYQTQGEQILEIMVDGQRFFEGDMETALKMLPAESVQNIEVYDYRSERARSTGVEEGNAGKSINIVTKEEYRKNIFGRGYAGYGADSEYHAGGNLNFRNDDKRVTILYQSNNVNQQNFAQEDVSEINSSSTSTSPGVSNVNAGGIDFANKLGEKTEISGTYLFDHTENQTESELLRNYLPGEYGDLNYMEESQGRGLSQNHNFNLRLQHQMTDRTTILFEPRFYLMQGKNKSSTESETVQNGSLLSTSNSLYANTNSNLNFAAPVRLSHRFKKRGRSLSVNFEPAYQSNSDENRLLNRYTSFGSEIILDSLSQSGANESNGLQFSGGLVFTEAISKKSMLFLKWNGAIQNDNSDSKVFQNGAMTSEIRRPDSLLSNIYKSQEMSQQIKPEYQFRSGKHFLKIGLGYKYSTLSSEQRFPENYNIEKKFEAVLPSLVYRAKLNTGRQFSFRYSTSNRTPQIHQLQTVPNNTNPMRQYTGNEQLDQEYRHSVSVNFSSSNLDKASVFVTGLYGTYVQNYVAMGVQNVESDTIIDNRIELQRGGQLYKPVNLDGYFNTSLFVSMDGEVVWLKSNLSVGLALNYSRMPGLINNENNWSQVFGPELTLGLQSNISEKIDFSIESVSSFENASYTLQSAMNNQFFRQTSSASLRLSVWRGLLLTADVNHQWLAGVPEPFDRSILLCNLGAGYRFLKDQQAELRLTVFDLFNNNGDVQRMIQDVYTDDYRTNVLNRYVMLTFTYHLRGIGKNKQ